MPTKSKLSLFLILLYSVLVFPMFCNDYLSDSLENIGFFKYTKHHIAVVGEEIKISLFLVDDSYQHYTTYIAIQKEPPNSNFIALGENMIQRCGL